MATAKKRAFELRGADGGPLRGDVRAAGGGSGAPAVVICHGFKGFKDWGFFPHLADRIAKAGITAISFNFSGSGVGEDGETFSEPERFAKNTYTRELKDLESVTAALAAGALVDGLAVPTKVGLFGHSRGAAAALIHASENDSMCSLVTWAAIGSVERWSRENVEQWRAEGKLDIVNSRTGDVLPLLTDTLDDIEQNRERLDLRKAASRLRIKWTIIHADDDPNVSLADAEKLYDAARKEDTDLLVIPGGGHTLGAKHPWIGMTPQLSVAMDATVNRFTNDLF
ncbi:MAG: alpha/beta fold hydrolase [Gemmatimonadetes bacterium]|nr:alpha/beta fold hydrolase [Gemmatimonadota bacterium]